MAFKFFKYLFKIICAEIFEIFQKKNQKVPRDYLVRFLHAFKLISAL